MKVVLILPVRTSIALQSLKIRGAKTQMVASKPENTMFARSKQIAEAGELKDYYTISRLYTEGKDIVKGVLVDERISKTFGQFGQELVREKMMNGSSVGVHEFVYSKKLLPKLMLDEVQKYRVEFEHDMSDVHGLLKKVLRARGYLDEYLYEQTAIANAKKGTEYKYTNPKGKQVYRKHSGLNRIGVNATLILPELGNMGISIATIDIKRVFKLDAILLKDTYHTTQFEEVVRTKTEVHRKKNTKGDVTVTSKKTIGTYVDRKEQIAGEGYYEIYFEGQSMNYFKQRITNLLQILSHAG